MNVLPKKEHFASDDHFSKYINNFSPSYAEWFYAMKFGAQWHSFITGDSNLPTPFRDASLDYKKYKKLSKSTCPDESIRKVLMADVSKTNETFMAYYRRSHTKRFALLDTCCLPPSCNNTLALYRYATFNTTCLYKICKRLDKRRHATPYFSQWYRNMLAERHFKFMNKDIQFLLGYDSRELQLEECPVCFDALTPHTTILLHCGHSMCEPCILTMLGVRHSRGTLHNLVAYGSHHNPHAAKCPICRDAHALRPFHKLATT